MSKLSKGYFATLKGKKVTFKRVKYGGDIKVEFVDRSPDYEVKIADRESSSKETIKVEIVERFGDVKLKTVDRSSDFEVYID